MRASLSRVGGSVTLPSLSLRVDLPAALLISLGSQHLPKVSSTLGPWPQPVLVAPGNEPPIPTPFSLRIFCRA